jgi:hypothetical protein
MFLCAVIGWRGSAFAEVHSPLYWRTGSCVLVLEYSSKRPSKPRHCATSRQLVKSLDHALKDLERETARRQMIARRVKVNRSRRITQTSLVL